LIVIPAILLVLLIVVVTFLRYLLTPSRTVLEREPTRYDMYDAGNPRLRRLLADASQCNTWAT